MEPTSLNLDIISSLSKRADEVKENQVMDMFAKMMAEENVSIFYGNYRTAMFDIKSRVMYIPKWENLETDIKILLRVHEIGHSIYTEWKGENFHKDIYAKYGKALASYVNVVEDDRVDRKMAKKFPGVRSIVASGVKALFNRGFFSLKSFDEVQNCIFIDRLNLNSKLGNVDAPFIPRTEKERDFYWRFKRTETFDEVIQLAKEIFEYAKYEEPEVTPPEETPEDKSDGESQGESSEGEGEESEEETQGESQEEGEGEESEEIGQSEVESNSENEDGKECNSLSGEPKSDDEVECKTMSEMDEAMDEIEKDQSKKIGYDELDDKGKLIILRSDKKCVVKPKQIIDDLSKIFL